MYDVTTAWFRTHKGAVFLLAVVVFVVLLISIVPHGWLNEHEGIGVWVEAVALILIFGLDWIERQERRAEHVEQLQAALDQLEVAQIPFLTFLRSTGTGYPGLRNAGFGPAINVHYTATPTTHSDAAKWNRDPRPISGYKGAIAREDEHSFSHELGVGTLEGNAWEIVVEYESLSERRYETKLTLDDKTQLTQVTFKRVQSSVESRSNSARVAHG